MKITLFTSPLFLMTMSIMAAADDYRQTRDGWRGRARYGGDLGGGYGDGFFGGYAGGSGGGYGYGDKVKPKTDKPLPSCGESAHIPEEPAPPCDPTRPPSVPSHVWKSNPLAPANEKDYLYLMDWSKEGNFGTAEFYFKKTCTQLKGIGIFYFGSDPIIAMSAEGICYRGKGKTYHDMTKQAAEANNLKILKPPRKSLGSKTTEHVKTPRHSKDHEHSSADQKKETEHGSTTKHTTSTDK